MGNTIATRSIENEDDRQSIETERAAENKENSYRDLVPVRISDYFGGSTTGDRVDTECTEVGTVVN